MYESLHSMLTMRFFVLVLAVGAMFAQAPPAPPPTAQNPAPPPGQVPGRGTEQTAPIPLPGETSAPNPRQEQPPGRTLAPGTTAGAAALSITLEDALKRARAYGQQYLAANIAAQLAREDRVQAKAALLPTVNYFNQFIYTEPNGTPSGVFVPNDGPHIYASQGIVHGDIFAPWKRAEYQRAIAAETAARARADIAARGMIATIVQNFYGRW
jgi:outer membrane protein